MSQNLCLIWIWIYVCVFAELREWQERFDAQVPGRNSHADPEASIDEKTGKQKRYYQLNTFVRVIMFQRIKAERAD